MPLAALLLELSARVPDGLVCFFTSYSYMEGIISQWREMGLLDAVRARGGPGHTPGPLTRTLGVQLLEHKLVFIETKDIVETTLALDNFKRACDCGRGAVRRACAPVARHSGARPQRRFLLRRCFSRSPGARWLRVWTLIATTADA